jgi:hypothetical protein
MTKQNLTSLNLPEAVRRLARTAAARRGLSMSQYVADLVERDCRANGVAALVERDRGEEREEVRHGR